jgi:hypothetical protein
LAYGQTVMNRLGILKQKERGTMTLKLALGLLSFAAFAQTPGQSSNNLPPIPPIKGLVVASTSVDPTTGDLTVGLQNTSSKTIVGYVLVVRQLDETGKVIIDAGFGWDYLEPDGDHHQYILAGQPGTILATKIVNKTVPVKVSVISVIYLDQTYEGPEASGALFNSRMDTAADIRKILAEKKHTPAEKAQLEKRAAFYESAAIPVEGK